MCEAELLPGKLGLSSRRLSDSPPPRSALPLAAAGIACLGLVPTFGGPDKPLHWAMTAGMVGVGMLLWMRHRLARRESPLASVARVDSRRAGVALLVISAVSSVLVLGIVMSQWLRAGPMGALSLGMPLFALLWLVTLGLQCLKHREGPDPAPQTDRPSRQPPTPRDGLSASQRPSSPPNGGPVSA